MFAIYTHIGENVVYRISTLMAHQNHKNKSGNNTFAEHHIDICKKYNRYFQDLPFSVRLPWHTFSSLEITE